MAWLEEALTNQTLLLVCQIEARCGQNEQIATIEVGVAVGVAASLCVLLLLCVTLRVSCACKAQQKATKTDIVRQAYPEVEDTELYINTEGAYRSGSDTDEEGECDKIAKEAQLRSRCADGM